MSETNSQLDRQAVEELVHKYCYFFDRNLPEELAALFTEDAVVDYGPEMANLVGRVQILEMVSKGLGPNIVTTVFSVLAGFACLKPCPSTLVFLGSS